MNMESFLKSLRLCLPGGVSMGLLMGCLLKPAPTNYLNYQTKTDLIFPLIGESFIAAGGRERKQNPAHILVPDQRFAIDIVALAPGSTPPDADELIANILSGKITTYEGSDPKINKNHYCFGRPIIAPGAGTVVDILDGIHDNIPGKRNKKDIPGNYVVIDHGNGEFSMLAHFRQGSVQVRKNQKVSTGDLLGQCGNSGHSNLPHLHYHLQNTSRWLAGEGLPAQFQRYYANGKLIDRGEPVQGEIISHPTDRLP